MANMATLEIRDCSCTEGAPCIHLDYIVAAFYCGGCGGMVSAVADDISGWIRVLTELRETRRFELIRRDQKAAGHAG
jgi:hypothetical protein